MEFEEMQVIWDSQREQEMYAIDVDAMHRKIKRKARQVERNMSLNEIGLMVICVFISLACLRDPVIEQTDYHKIFGSVVMLCVAAWMLMKRLARLKMRSQFDSTLTGDLDRAIAESKAQLTLARTFHLWFVLPAVSIVLVNTMAKSEPLLEVFASTLGVFLSIALAIAVVHLGIRCSQVPEQRDLQALRDTLTKEG
ncbi:MAG: hypothetical protein CMJ93_07265 [Planctomycetes bacterium]|nr:hypothetical protein [Planctomycetota bacterium]|tara:strand:- start:1819 stop:2406 length:588 start_codon:yes stop_codon:yes gene_type:complete